MSSRSRGAAASDRVSVAVTAAGFSSAAAPPSALAATSVVNGGRQVLGELRLDPFAAVPTIDLGAAVAGNSVVGWMRAVAPAGAAVLTLDRVTPAGGGAAAASWSVSLLPEPAALPSCSAAGASELAFTGSCLLRIEFHAPAGVPSGRARAGVWFRANGRQRLNIIVLARTEGGTVRRDREVHNTRAGRPMNQEVAEAALSSAPPRPRLPSPAVAAGRRDGDE